jgi:hypothetical protein
VRTEVGFKDRFDDEFHCHLRYPVSDRRDAQRAQAAVRFGYHDAPHRLGSVGFVFQVLGQFPQKRFYPLSILYSLAHPSTPGCRVGLDQPPSMTEDVLRLILS